jgi:CheY-like chemotaxis protein
MKNTEPVELLFIERNPGNLKQLFEVFNGSKLSNNIRFAGNADQALRMIFQYGEYSKVPRPDLIIFDIQSYHKKMGVGILTEVLAKIAKAETIKCIPTVILTSLEEKEEELEIQNCPNLLINKPDKSEDYQNIVKSIEKFWLKHKNDKIS